MYGELFSGRWLSPAPVKALKHMIDTARQNIEWANGKIAGHAQEIADINEQVTKLRKSVAEDEAAIKQHEHAIEILMRKGFEE